jgi:hypothetical protein
MRFCEMSALKSVSMRFFWSPAAYPSAIARPCRKRPFELTLYSHASVLDGHGFWRKQRFTLRRCGDGGERDTRRLISAAMRHLCMADDARVETHRIAK